MDRTYDSVAFAEACRRFARLASYHFRQAATGRRYRRESWWTEYAARQQKTGEAFVQAIQMLHEDRDEIFGPNIHEWPMYAQEVN